MNKQTSQQQPESGTGGLTESPEYLNKRELAARLGISIRSCDNLIARRVLPFVRLGSPKLIRFPKTEVDRYIREHLTVRARGSEGGESHA